MIEQEDGLQKDELTTAYLTGCYDTRKAYKQRLAEAEAKLAETEKALRWVCDVYIVDDYYSDDLRKERLESAVRYAMKKGRLKETSGSEGE